MLTAQRRIAQRQTAQRRPILGSVRRTIRPMKRIVLLAVAVFGFACIGPTEACGCLPTLGIGTVAGVVRSASGALAPGASVRVEARLQSCDLREPSAVVDGP